MSGPVPATEQSIFINRIEVRRLMLPFAESFEARHGRITGRDIVVVRIDSEIGVGWGECSALPEPTYTDEFASGAFAVLSDELAPRLVRHELSIMDLVSKLSIIPGNPMAKASLEMAMLDLVLKSRSISLAEWLGAANLLVPAGATVGIMSSNDAIQQVSNLREQGFRRVKLKIESSAGLDLVGDLHEAYPDLELQIDPNGGCQPDDIARLVSIADKLHAIEQPFDPSQVEAARQLVAQVTIPIIADEPIESLAAATTLLNNKACSAVALKPSRLGGLLTTKSLHDACLAWDVPMAAGGMFECGLGRHSLAAVAAMEGCTITGDLSPASRWLAVDPWPDIEMKAGPGPGQIVVPSGAGVAPAPDLQILESVTSNTTMVS